MRNVFRILYSVLLFAAGTLHFTNERVFRSIVPKSLPFRKGIVLVSGAFELFFSFAIWAKKGRAVIGKLLAVFMVLVFPANIYMAMKNKTYIKGKKMHPALLWLRLPLQIPLILGALYVTKEDKTEARKLQAEDV
ncbi:hypothetical protein JCM19039_4703 [Geomicrobium sp. JCM 19039]|nr:hypothetical protein JCM19039_4703 [Geomicrobium sp. JCM 19039]